MFLVWTECTNAAKTGQNFQVLWSSSVEPSSLKVLWRWDILTLPIIAVRCWTDFSFPLYLCRSTSWTGEKCMRSVSQSIEQHWWFCLQESSVKKVKTYLYWITSITTNFSVRKISWVGTSKKLRSVTEQWFLLRRWDRRTHFLDDKISSWCCFVDTTQTRAATRQGIHRHRRYSGCQWAVSFRHFGDVHCTWEKTCSHKQALGLGPPSPLHTAPHAGNVVSSFDSQASKHTLKPEKVRSLETAR